MLKFKSTFCKFTNSFSHCSKLFVDSTKMDKMRSRLLYQSKKRGILENDILIGGFAEENLHTMEDSELELYDRIINGKHMEWDLFNFFTGKKEAPTDLKENPLFEKMRNYVMDKK